MMHNTGIKSGSAETATGALSVNGPQPVWMTLDEARDRAFTGEIVFEVDPEVLAYLDHGVIYYAERTSDEPLGRRLLEAGVVDTSQLERGTVRVGDVEHLGRLFDRDASVDRDAVLVVTETATEDLIAELANQAAATVRVTAYRHHPSGVHRWFAAPVDAPALARPVSPVAQIDNTVIDELPGIAIPTHPGIEDLSIEWDDITDLSADDSGSIDEFELVLFDPFRESEMSVDSLAGADVDADLDADADPEVIELALDMAAFTDTVDADIYEFPVERPVGSMTTNGTPVDDMADFEFQVVWPNGSEESVTTTMAEAPVADAPAFTETAEGELHFDMPALELVDDDAATDEVPDDVAAAVRRAIAAIESASADTASIAPIEIDAPSVELSDGVVIDTFDTELVVDTAPPATVPTVTEITTQVPTVPVTLGGFAPPTMDMAAEAIYAREAAAIEAAEMSLSAEPTLAEPPALAEAAPMLEATPANQGVASVVFVDDEPVAESDDSNERSSALRRLIGSLRRKDH
jgi:hypothetical protein